MTRLLPNIGPESFLLSSPCPRREQGGQSPWSGGNQHTSRSIHSQPLSCIRLFATPWTVARQAPLSAGFPRQEYWSELPFPPPGDLPNPGIKPESPVVPVAGGFFTTDHLRSPTCQHRHPPIMPSTSGSLSSLPFHPRFQGQRDPAGSWRKTSSLVPVSLPAGLLPTHSR